MKKTLMTCIAVIALLAIAASAGAITCTIDQRPAATLLVPYFEASIAPDGTAIGTGPDARDTLVTICNASNAPMIVHVNLFSERTELVLDYNIALTEFDCQAMRMSDIVRGFLPQTGFVAGSPPALRDACQRNFGAGATQSKVFPDANGFIRTNPSSPATPLDNSLATTVYPQPAWPANSQFAFEVLDSLDDTPDSRLCDPTPDGSTGGNGVDGVISGIIRGYLTLDHANYCNLSSPADAVYYDNDAIGMENNLFGEVIFTSGSGVPTMGGSTVNIEAATDSNETGPLDAPPLFPNRPFENQTDANRARTFYARYWTPSTESFCTNDFTSGCATGDSPCSPWNCAEGDAREPLGLKYAARWFSLGEPAITSNFNVWRGSSGSLTDLLGSPFTDCDTELPVVSLTFFDEDENTVSQGVCPSPCTQPQFNFPLETQRVSISGFAGATPTAAAGWVSMAFFNNTAPNIGSLDQAWVEYDFQGPGAFLSISSPGTQLDPSACNPLGVTGVQNIGPVIPVIVGTGP
jgi:hypothetical protein